MSRNQRNDTKKLWESIMKQDYEERQLVQGYKISLILNLMTGGFVGYGATQYTDSATLGIGLGLWAFLTSIL